MFRIAAFNPPGVLDQNFVDAIHLAHPATISAFMEDTWANRPPGLGPVPPPMPAGLLAPVPPVMSGNRPTVRSHLIEAFCLENTRMIEIFQRVVALYLQGEQLASPPDLATSNVAIDIGPWLRTTEMLFFNDTSPYSSFTVTSSLRADPHLVRQNAYIRMFGSNVLNPIQNDPAVKQMPPAAANREFWGTLERFLAEVWRGIVNSGNTSGRNDADAAAVARYALFLNDMMGTRRLGLAIDRQEFAACCLTNWFHMVLLWNSPIVRALKSEADSPADRLSKLGERVGVPAHSRTASYIQLANLLGTLMLDIESGLYNSAITATNLYMVPANAQRLSEIITLYMNATGRDLKASTVSVAMRA
jgi:hypothetical protein